MKHTRYSLRALARLLSYPDQQLRGELDALVDAIDTEGAVPVARRAELRTLANNLQRQDPMEVEARYVETFDRGRATSLHLFEHVHGDSRDRGPAMIDLAQTYEKAGLFLAPDELPDHLCVVLEFASTQPPQLARAFLGEMAHILNAIFSALIKRESPYAAVVAAVLELAGAQQLRGVALPRVLVAVEADQAAQQEHGQADIGVVTEEEVVEVVHGHLLASGHVQAVARSALRDGRTMWMG